MIKSVEEFKELVLWAKKNKVKRLKVDSIEVDISELAFLDEDNAIRDIKFPNITNNQESQDAEDEDLMYWSSNS